ncbi:MAG: hypothetical protein QM538_02740 [Methylacidiphilales bacterium]|nr:hypothetical protein [Candidatus Methylacidiphilales bacterium]
MTNDLTRLLQQYECVLTSEDRMLTISRRAKLSCKFLLLGKWIRKAASPLSFVGGILVSISTILYAPSASQMIASIFNPNESTIATTNTTANLRQINWKTSSKDEPQVLEIPISTKRFIPNANVKVTLDDNISIERYPMVKKITFQTDISPEHPVINIPVIKTDDHEANIIVEIETPDKSQVMLYQIVSDHSSDTSPKVFDASFQQ